MLTLNHPILGVVLVKPTQYRVVWGWPRFGTMRSFLCQGTGTVVAIYDRTFNAMLADSLDKEHGMCDGHAVAGWITDEIQKEAARAVAQML